MLARCQQLHQHWQSRVDQAAECLQQLAPDLVLANAPYLTLAAAAGVK